MNPLKAKHLLPDLAKQENLPLEFLEDLTEFYWTYSNREVVSLEHYNVMIPNIGTWGIKGDQKIDIELEKLYRMVESSRRKTPTTSKRYAIWKSKEEKIQKLERLREQAIKHFSDKKANKILRADVRLKKDLEQSEANSGRSD